ncbi:hypothetical protein Tco_1136335 [Tanacetum coccineum]
MGTIDGMKSILTQFALDVLCEKFHIPDTVHPELPGRNDRIRNSPIDILEYFQINLSQLSVIAAAKVSHFEILCRVYGFVPTADSLKHWNDHFFWVDASVFPLDVPWHNNKTLRKDPYHTPAEFDADVCNYLADNPAPFRKFLELLCFVGISRYYELDDGEMDLFAFIHHADPTKVWIGEREVGEGEDARVPVVNEEIGDDAMADQIEGSDHVVQDERADIVHIEGEVPTAVAEKAKGADHGTSGAGASTGGKFVAALQSLLERSTLPVEVGVAAMDTLPFVTSSVSLTPEHEGGGRTDSVTGPNQRTQNPSERFVVLSDSPCHSRSNTADAEVSSVVRSLAPEPPILTTTVVTTVVAAASSVLVPRVAVSRCMQVFLPILPMLDMDSETLRQIYVPKWNVLNESALDDPDMCRSLVDHLAPPVLFSQLRSIDYDLLFAEFNVGAARQTCLGAEVRMRLEHTLREKKKFKGRLIRQDDLLKERDAEVASLKAQLSLKEAEPAEAIRLRGQVALVEAAKAAQVNELNGLKERTTALEGQVATLESAVVIKDTELVSSNAQITKLTQDLSNFQLSCDELSVKVASLEFEKDKLVGQVSTLEATCSGLRDEVSGYKLFKEHIEAVQDEQVRVLSDRVAVLDSELMEMALHIDEEFYPRYLTTIAGRRWILGRGLKLTVMKCLQSPKYLAALGGVIGRAIDKGMQDGLVLTMGTPKEVLLMLLLTILLRKLIISLPSTPSAPWIFPFLLNWNPTNVTIHIFASFYVNKYSTIYF